MGRCLLVLTMLSLVTMPITQHFWTWDHFLQGGRDFESGIIAVLSIFLLVLVLSKSYKQCVDVLFSARRYLVIKFGNLFVSVVPLSEASSNLRGIPPLPPSAWVFGTSLQV